MAAAAAAASAWSDDIALEVEALEATYGDHLAAETGKGVSMLLVPEAAKIATYVQCQLSLFVTPGYPATSPAISLSHARGLGSKRLTALQQHLEQEASAMLGEFVLGHLFESTKEWLTENNWPEGACIFCLDDMHQTNRGNNATNSTAGCEQHCMRLPCFHAFHQLCFRNWWCWQQLELDQQQQQLRQQTGATAAAALIQEKLPPRECQHFQLTCPVCRAQFTLQQHLPHMHQQLSEQLQYQQQQQRTLHSAGAQTYEAGAASKLSQEQLAPFLDIQQRHAVLFAAQLQRQGIVTESRYSIADWDAAASAAARHSDRAPSGGSSSTDIGLQGSQGNRNHDSTSHRSSTNSSSHCGKCKGRGHCNSASHTSNNSSNAGSGNICQQGGHGSKGSSSYNSRGTGRGSSSGRQYAMHYGRERSRSQHQQQGQHAYGADVNNQFTSEHLHSMRLE